MRWLSVLLALVVRKGKAYAAAQHRSDRESSGIKAVRSVGLSMWRSMPASRARATSLICP